jgi:hypothetical protein
MERTGLERKGGDGIGFPSGIHIGGEGRGKEWIGLDRIGVAFFHASTRERRASDGNGKDRRGLASSMRPQWMGTDRRGGDRIGQEGPSFRCPQRIGMERIGAERNGAERKGVDWISSMRPQRMGTECIGVERRGKAFLHASTTEWSGAEWKGAERKGMVLFQSVTVERKAEDWTGWERIGAEGIGVFQTSGGER